MTPNRSYTAFFSVGGLALTDSLDFTFTREGSIEELTQRPAYSFFDDFSLSALESGATVPESSSSGILLGLGSLVLFALRKWGWFAIR